MNLTPLRKILIVVALAAAAYYLARRTGLLDLIAPPTTQDAPVLSKPDALRSTPAEQK